MLRHPDVVGCPLALGILPQKPTSDRSNHALKFRTLESMPPTLRPEEKWLKPDTQKSWPFACG